jgi:hypothetical protein
MREEARQGAAIIALPLRLMPVMKHARTGSSPGGDLGRDLTEYVVVHSAVAPPSGKAHARREAGGEQRAASGMYNTIT